MTQTVGEPATAKRHPLAVVALIVGIVALIVGLVPLLGLLSVFVLGPAGVIIGAIALTKTGAGKAAGRGFALAGLIMSAAAIVVAIAESAYINYSANKTLDAIYGPIDDEPTEAASPGTTWEEALAFGQTMKLPNGLTITATKPVARKPDDPAVGSDLTYGWSTTVTFTNTSSAPIQLAPTANGTPSNINGYCQPFTGDGLQAIDDAAGSLEATAKVDVTLGFACYYEDTVYLEVQPDATDESAWFVNELP